jgi:hypothetical protein
METPGATAANLLDALGTISVDLACRRCGYNLRGLNHAGRCPECGTPVGLSCHGDLLRFADPTWVDKLGRGVRYVLWGILVGFLAALVGAAFAGFLQTEAIGTVITIAGSLVGLYGAWLITAPDPSGIGEDKYVTDRKVVRFTLLLGLAAQLVQFLTEVLTLPAELELALVGVAMLGALGAVGGEFAKLHYFQKLALRIPDPALAGRARALRWGMAFTLGPLVLFGGLAALVALVGNAGVTTAGGPGVAPVGIPSAPGLGRLGASALGPVMVLGCLAGVAGLAYCVVAILVLVLIYRLGKAFREQARLARATWAAAEPQAMSPV